jgi:hypothetical protein
MINVEKIFKLKKNSIFHKTRLAGKMAEKQFSEKKIKKFINPLFGVIFLNLKNLTSLEADVNSFLQLPPLEEEDDDVPSGATTSAWGMPPPPQRFPPPPPAGRRKKCMKT